MTQFAYFTGQKPNFPGLEFSPIGLHHTRDYVGAALSEVEKKTTWVIASPSQEVIETMAKEAMICAQKSGAIKGTQLYRLLKDYIDICDSITFIYGTYDEDVPIYSNPDDFMNAIVDSLRVASFEIYAKYVSS